MVVASVAAGSKCEVSPYREISSSGVRQTLDSKEISTLINCKPRISEREDNGEALIGGGAGTEPFSTSAQKQLNLTEPEVMSQKCLEGFGCGEQMCQHQSEFFWLPHGGLCSPPEIHLPNLRWAELY